MSDSSTKRSDVVKSVFYAVVMSAWASTICSHTKGVQAFLKWIDIIASDATKFSAALMSIGVFVFLTLYFHDECKYGNPSEYPNYPEESPAIQCTVWSFFLLQVCLLGHCLVVSVILGIVGITLISFAPTGLILYSRLGWRKKFANWRFLVENVIMIGIFISSLYWPCVALLALAIAVLRIFPYGLPKRNEGGDNNERNNRNDA